MKIHLYLSVFFLCCLTGRISILFSQNTEFPTSEIEKLEAKLNEDISDTEQQQVNGKLAKLYFYSNTGKAYEYATAARELAVKNEDKGSQIYYLKLMGLSQSMAGNYVNGIIHFYEALATDPMATDTALIDVYQSMGIAYQMMGDYAAALKQFDRSIALADSMELPEKAAPAIGCIGNLYAQQGDYARAITETKKGIRVSGQYNKQKLLAYGYKDLAFSMGNMGAFDSAFFYLRQSLDITTRQEDIPFIAGETYVVLSQMYLKAGNTDSAIYAANMAIGVGQKIHAKRILIQATEATARAYLQAGQTASALKFAQKMEETARTSVALYQRDASRLLADVYEETGNYRKSAEYLRKVNSLDQEIRKKEREDSDALHEKLVVLHKKAEENRILTERIERDRLQIYKSNTFGITMGLFALVIVVAFFLIYINQTPIVSRPLLSVSFSDHETEQRLQFVRRLSVVVFLLVIPILAHSILWGNIYDIIAKGVFMLMMIAMHLLALRKKLSAIFYSGLIIVYPITILPSVFIGIKFALPLIPVTIFLVWNYLAQRPVQQMLNIAAMAINLALSYWIRSRIQVLPIQNVEMLDIMVSLMALLLIIITLIYTNQLVYDSKLELYRNNRFLRQISDINPHFIFAKDSSRRLIFANKALAENFGVTQEGLLGKRDEDIHPLFAEDPHFYGDEKAVLENGETIFRMYEKIQDAGGNEKWVATIKKPIYDDNNHIIGILGVGSDVTEQLKAEEKLRKNEAMLNAIIHSIPDPILAIKDIQTPIFYNNKRITGYNTTFKELFAGNAINWKTVFPAEVVSRYIDIISRVSQGKTIRVRDAFVNGDNTTYFSITFAPITDLHGENSGTVIIVRDETELKTKELDLNRKNEQLKKYIESNLNLENFAYLASHDLSAPIRTIVSFTQLLEKRLTHVISDEDKEYLDFVVSASKNMQRLIHDLLTYSRVNTTKINIFPLNVPQLLEEIQNELYIPINEKKATLIYTNIPETISADRIKFRQLLSNLIMNALKFSQPGIPPQIEISCEIELDQWRFHVKDNGIGIAKEYQENIFLLFRRLHKESEYEGTGIGLALCKKIVEQHKGEMGVNSEKGKGSDFYFTIPIEKIESQITIS
ncbi:MAG: ATP-binding protein [Bacteroidia bacterium]